MLTISELKNFYFVVVSTDMREQGTRLQWEGNGWDQWEDGADGMVGKMKRNKISQHRAMQTAVGKGCEQFR